MWKRERERERERESKEERSSIILCLLCYVLSIQNPDIISISPNRFLPVPPRKKSHNFAKPPASIYLRSTLVQAVDPQAYLKNMHVAENHRDLRSRGRGRDREGGSEVERKRQRGRGREIVRGRERKGERERERHGSPFTVPAINDPMKTPRCIRIHEGGRTVGFSFSFRTTI